jgi:hypothetical protein
MVVRLGRAPDIGPAASMLRAAADYLAEAGRSRGQGYAAFGAGIRSGIESAVGQIQSERAEGRARAERAAVRGEENKYREADDARANRALQLQADQHNFAMLDKIAAESEQGVYEAEASGDPAALQEAMARAQTAKTQRDLVGKRLLDRSPSAPQGSPQVQVRGRPGEGG